VLWHRPLWKVIPLGIVLLTIDLFFFAANLRKVVDGGWLPLMIAIGVFTMFMTWRKGNEIVTVNRTKKEGSLHQFIEGFREMKPPVQRVPGMAVFLHANPETTPLSMRANVEHNHSLHKHVIIMSIKVLPYPHLDHDSWLMVDDSGYRDDGIIHATVRVGFKDHIDVPELVDIAAKEGLWCKVQESECTYFLSKMNIYRSEKPGLADWRKRLFVAMSRHATNPVDLFNLPVERTIIMGGRIAV
jgi:KUP system potassium uptake protein